jgi:hypothetical protein
MVNGTCYLSTFFLCNELTTLEEIYFVKTRKCCGFEVLIALTMNTMNTVALWDSLEFRINISSQSVR